MSKSLNSNVVAGLTELPPIFDLLLDFFVCPYVSLFDIRKCYRSIFTSDQTNNLRLISLWENKNDTQCSAILKYQRMCFGDVCASTVLLLAYAHYVLPTLTSPLARNVLSTLYVDDSLTGSRSKQELEESVGEVIDKLAHYNFFPKFVFFNWKQAPPEVGDEITVFHQNWHIP